MIDVHRMSVDERMMNPIQHLMWDRIGWMLNRNKCHHSQFEIIHISCWLLLLLFFSKMQFPNTFLFLMKEFGLGSWFQLSFFSISWQVKCSFGLAHWNLTMTNISHRNQFQKFLNHKIRIYSILTLLMLPIAKNE